MTRFLKTCLTAPALALIVCGVSLAGQTPLETASGLEAQAKSAEQAGRLREAFDLYVRAEQALPSRGEVTNSMRPTLASMVDMDIRVRERIIALAARLQPLPAVPEDAERFGVRGQVLFKDAQDEYGFLKAMFELDKAVHAAPWVPIYAFNLAVVQEKLGYYKVAAANLKLYAASAEADAAEVRTKMFELELRREDPTAALSEDCGFFHRAAACLTRGRELSAVKETSIEGRLMLSDACLSGSAEGCLEFGQAKLADTLEIEKLLKDSSRVIGERYQPKGLETVDVYLEYIQRGCTMKLAAACRELGTFFAKDWSDIGIKKNNKTAAEWYQRTCDLDPVANKVDCERARRLR